MKRYICIIGVFLVGCGQKYTTLTETVYRGGEVVGVEAETNVRHSEQGIRRTSWVEHTCKVTVWFETGDTITNEENIEPVFCYKLQKGDWIDGWQQLTTKTYEDGDVVTTGNRINFSIAQEISKRLN